MLLRSATFRNVGPFKDFRLDVEDKRGLVAITASNGSGKTFSLEAALLGACYRKMETQGTLVGRATDRDAWVESSIVFRQPFTVRQVVDGVSKAQETLLLDASGEPILSDTKVTTYGAWAARNLPDQDVYLSSLFCAQGSEGFVQMSSGDRIGVILRVLGVARLERMAKAAAARAAAAEAAFKALVTRIADAKGGDLGVEAGEVALVAARHAVDEAEAAVTEAKAALIARQQAASNFAVRKAKREAADTLATTLRAQAEAAEARQAKDATVLANNRMIQADALKIRAAAAGLEAANAELTRLELALTETDKAIRAELDPWRDGAARLGAAEQRRAAAQGRLKDEAAVRQAATDRATLAAAVDAEKTAVAAMLAELEALQATRLAGADDRISSLRLGLAVVQSLPEIELAHEAAIASLADDDTRVTLATETPRQLAELKARLVRERDHLAVAERKLADAERLAVRLSDLDVAKADREAAEREASELRAGHAVAVLSAALRAVGRGALAAEAAAKGEALKVTRLHAGRIEPLEASELRIAELERQMEEDAATASRAREQIVAIESVDAGEPVDVASAEGSVAAAEARAKYQAIALTKAEEALARSLALAAKVAGLEAERDAAATELADWNRLELDLGRKGIQSAEVDSAGPELTALCNELLHGCHGPRYSVLVETQRLDAAGKKMVDDCIITVFDSERGTKKEVREHSGGERTILAEALSLALTMMGSRRAGFSDFTIVRDESGAALDPANNRAYVAMLRHALAVTGARHVLLVSHSKEVQEMCDHIIEIPEAA